MRADEVDMAVDAAGREQHALARDDLGRGADRDRDAWLYVGVAGLAERPDAAVFQAHVGLHDPQHGVHDDGVRDDRVGDLGAEPLRLPHAIADDLAAAERDLFAVGREVPLDADPELGVGEAHPIPGRRTVHLGVGAAVDHSHGSRSPITTPWKPKTLRAPLSATNSTVRS